MSVRKIRGIVIREQVSGESGKQLVVLAKGAGKLRLSARGAKNAKSKLLAGTQLFAYCDFTLFEGKGFLSVTQADLLESFYGLRTDVEVLSEAVYLAELVEKTCPEGMEQDDILLLLLYALQWMAKGYIPPRLAGRIFEIKYLLMSGLFAGAECAVCQREEEPMYFSSREGVFLCGRHKDGNSVMLLPAVQEAISHVLSKEGQKIFAFRLSEDALDQLDGIMEQYLRVHVGVSLKSRHFLY